jgi:hypothetical protein
MKRPCILHHCESIYHPFFVAWLSACPFGTLLIVWLSLVIRSKNKQTGVAVSLVLGGKPKKT